MAVDDDDQLTGLRGDERIVKEARLEFKRCQEWQADADKKSLEDEKFSEGDARNHWQWPDGIYNARTTNGEDRPCLTINATRIHNDIVINKAIKNRASIKVRPTGGKATYEAAQAMQSIVRRIEYISKASIAYNMAFKKQVDGGLGYIFIETAYVNERSFDQDIYLRGCLDPRCVFLDPDIKQPDGSDAKLGFIFERIERREFNRRYPKFKNRIGKSTLGRDDAWLTDDHVQVATYYRKKGSDDTFVSFVDPQSGDRIEKLASEIEAESGKEILDGLLEQILSGEVDGRTREVVNETVQWFLIAGDCIIARDDWLGKYVPIIRCVGRETIIEGKLDRKGLTRAQIDANRMLNYNASGSVEFGALQSKTPYIGPARAFEGQEQWKDANTKNYAFLAYNDLDEEAGPDLGKIDRPQRQEPPQAAPVHMQGMADAERWHMIVTGQFQAQLGENDQQSAASGVGIGKRTEQGDTATYDFIEHQSDMLRFIGAQLINLIPKIYDTQRTLHVLGEDGTKRWIQIDPNQPEAVQELKKETDEAAQIAFNPRVGEYDCMSDPGPNYATQRQEAFDSISLMLQQNMVLAGIIGDLQFKYGDFPGADEIADRLKKEIRATKPYLFSDQDPGLASMQQQLQQLQALNGDLVQKLAEMQLKLKGREQRRDIEAHRAETDRIVGVSTAIKNTAALPGTREELLSLIHQAVSEGLTMHLTEITRANAADIGDPLSDRQ